MMRGRHLLLVKSLCVVGLVLASTAAAPADEIQVTVRADGVTSVARPAQADAWPPRLGAQPMFSVELGAHGLEWLHVPQKYAKIDQRRAPNPRTVAVTGSLRVPDGLTPAQGTDLVFREEVSLKDTGMTVSYAVRPSAAATVCGLQVSAYLDAAAYQGATVRFLGVKTPNAGFQQEKWYTLPDDPVQAEGAATDEGDEPKVGLPTPGGETDEGDEAKKPKVGLPTPGEEAEPPAEAAATPPFADADPVTLQFPIEAAEDNWELWSGFCKRIEIAGPENLSFTITAPKAYRFVIQDNRKWGTPVFEIRVAFVMTQEGLEITDEDEFLARLEFGFKDATRLVKTKAR